MVWLLESVFFYILGNLENIIQIRAKEFKFSRHFGRKMIFKISQQDDFISGIINIIIILNFRPYPVSCKHCTPLFIVETVIILL